METKFAQPAMQIVRTSVIQYMSIICIASCDNFVSGFVRIDLVADPFPSPLSMKKSVTVVRMNKRNVNQSALTGLMSLYR